MAIKLHRVKWLLPSCQWRSHMRVKGGWHPLCFLYTLRMYTKFHYVIVEKICFWPLKMYWLPCGTPMHHFWHHPSASCDCYYRPGDLACFDNGLVIGSSVLCKEVNWLHEPCAITGSSRVLLPVTRASGRQSRTSACQLQRPYVSNEIQRALKNLFNFSQKQRMCLGTFSAPERVA